ncbi:MAG: DNA repair protein RadA [Bdellovibrionales bacterium]
MAKSSTRYVCQACGTSHSKWVGKCEGCAEWNTLVEEQVAVAPPKSIGASKGAKGKGLTFAPLIGGEPPPPRILSNINEFDRVTGGGLVPGSVLLIGGDPGIGKSTLLLQVVAKVASKVKCAYVSGEEALDQVRLRAERLGLTQAPVELAASTDIRSIVASMEGSDAPNLIVIDSIQTMYVDVLDSAPGTVAQVRAAAHELIRAAKKHNITVLIVGHVTKEGTLAGPRVLEHMVDTVLYFEGERGHHFRILRAVKNRFGPTDEIGVFEMQQAGLMEVSNPSALFLSERQGDVSGAAVFAGIEGTRPVLVEIQALVSPSPLGTPRRAVIGWDSGRLAMIIAVLEARAGISIGMNDVYLNVAGGLKISEPAADLAVAAALLSSLSGTPVPREAVFYGEIGLSGEIRTVSQSEPRLKEAAKLGFERAFVPEGRKGTNISAGLKLSSLKTLANLVPYFDVETRKKKAG